MKKKIPTTYLALFIIGAALLILTGCDEWINIEVWITNDSGHMIDAAWIEYEDGEIDDIFYNIPSGSQAVFYISTFDTDRYTTIRAFVDDGGFIYSTAGNVAENDWLTVISYPADF